MEEKNTLAVSAEEKHDDFTYAIYEGNMERLRKKITAIRNKCLKYGVDFTYEEVGETYKEFTDSHGEKYTLRYVLVHAEGTAKVNDWRFVSTVEHTEKGNILRRACNIEVPERYYHSEPVCEHCNCKRSRRETYLVHNEVTG